MAQSNLKFSVDPRIDALGIPVAVARIQGLNNRADRTVFDSECERLYQKWDERFDGRLPTDDPTLRGFKDLHTKVGRSNKRFVASTENLILSFLRNRSIPSVNLAVDIYNAMSIETMLSIGAHDCDNITGDVALRVLDGSENFIPLGSTEAKEVSAGEYGYVDSANDLLCRMECRQADKTKLDSGSTDCIFIVQGNGNTSKPVVVEVLDRLVERIVSLCGGEATVLYS